MQRSWPDRNFSSARNRTLRMNSRAARRTRHKAQIRRAEANRANRRPATMGPPTPKTEVAAWGQRDRKRSSSVEANCVKGMVTSTTPERPTTGADGEAEGTGARVEAKVSQSSNLPHLACINSHDQPKLVKTGLEIQLPQPKLVKTGLEIQWPQLCCTMAFQMIALV